MWCSVCMCVGMLVSAREYAGWRVTLGCFHKSLSYFTSLFIYWEEIYWLNLEFATLVRQADQWFLWNPVYNPSPNSTYLIWRWGGYEVKYPCEYDRHFSHRALLLSLLHFETQSLLLSYYNSDGCWGIWWGMGWGWRPQGEELRISINQWRMMSLCPCEERIKTLRWSIAANFKEPGSEQEKNLYCKFIQCKCKS